MYTETCNDKYTIYIGRSQEENQILVSKTKKNESKCALVPCREWVLKPTWHFDRQVEKYGDKV